jgi:hypothetical protein
MKLFKNKPNWLRPEIDEPKYYLHLLVISVVVFGLLELFISKGMFTVKNILLSVPLLLAGDIVAHTILKLR